MAERQPTVLITGSEGLIGDRVVQNLTRDFDLASFDIERPHKLPEVQDFIHCDLTSDESVAQALEEVRQRHGNRLASVIHLAAYYDFSGEPSRLYDDLTVEGTRRLLRGLQTFEVEQFVFSSTLLVMKPCQKGELLTEDSPLEAEWLYPQSKLDTERLIHAERGKVKTVILRVAGVYDEDGNSVPIAHQISRIYEKKLESYAFPGDTSTGQAFVHLDDLVDCVRRVIDRRRELDDEEVFLIAEPDVMSYDELQDAIGELTYGREWPTIRIPKPLAKAGAWAMDKLDQKAFIKPWMIDLADHHYPVSIERARRKLGWNPARRLRQTLPEIIRRLKEDPQRWYETNNLELPKELPTPVK
ncbi:MAG: NAD(P)-dependent oxidoreductase [Bryobacteraceae bacterium]|nr:NAD(P)-dependent oxidoreductase [Bryobacteraceae bacterium]